MYPVCHTYGTAVEFPPYRTYVQYRTVPQKTNKIVKILLILKYSTVEEDEELLKDVVVVSDFDVVKGILSYAKDNKPDVVIMTTHGRKGLEHFFNGSISEDTVELIDTPIITVKY